MLNKVSDILTKMPVKCESTLNIALKYPPFSFSMLLPFCLAETLLKYIDLTKYYILCILLSSYLFKYLIYSLN